MELEKAQLLAEPIVQRLKPHCSKIVVAGSIRRKRPFVHDIDLVCIPSSQGQFIAEVQSMGKVELAGKKLVRCQTGEIMLDIYIAAPETWATLLLIRTGSKRHNIMLCALAKRQGMILHADGTGLFRPGASAIYGPPALGADERIAGDTEASIFEALGLAYVPPEGRE